MNNYTSCQCTVSKKSLYDDVVVLKQTNQVIALYTMIRDQRLARADFVYYSDRIIRMLVEEALNYLPVDERVVTTPLGEEYKGATFKGSICGVSIMRAGESMENGLRACCRAVKIGKVLIQRNDETAQPELFYVKFPPDISQRYVLLLDPMLATAGSAIMACNVLKDRGVSPDRIIFLNLIAAPLGIENFVKACPGVRVITGFIDDGLNVANYISPGLGDFGDRYFGTEES